MSKHKKRANKILNTNILLKTIKFLNLKWIQKSTNKVWNIFLISPNIFCICVQKIWKQEHFSNFKQILKARTLFETPRAFLEVLKKNYMALYEEFTMWSCLSFNKLCFFWSFFWKREHYLKLPERLSTLNACRDTFSYLFAFFHSEKFRKCRTCRKPKQLGIMPWIGHARP